MVSLMRYYIFTILQRKKPRHVVNKWQSWDWRLGRLSVLVIDRMLVFPQNSYIETPTLNVMTFGDGDFER